MRSAARPEGAIIKPRQKLMQSLNLNLILINFHKSAFNENLSMIDMMAAADTNAHALQGKFPNNKLVCP